MGKKKFIAIIAGLVTLGAWASIYLSVWGLPPRLDARPHEALGGVVAEEALKLRAPGGKIVLICRDTTRFKSPAGVAEIRSFQSALKAAGAGIATTNLIRLDPLRLSSVPPGDFFQLLQRLTDSDVVVSFLGPPVLTPDQLAKLGEKKPKVLAVCTGSTPGRANLKRLFDDKVLHAAVVSRRSVGAGPPTPDTVRNWFDHLFTLITPTSSELGSPPSQ